jgi:hypothetical protein
MELALKGHRRLRSNRKLALKGRRPKLDLVQIVRTAQLRREHEQRAAALEKSGLTGPAVISTIL